MRVTKRLNWSALLVATGLAVEGVNAATPHTINASQIGTGVLRSLNWNDEAIASPVWCGTACSYLQISTAKVAPAVLTGYSPTAWPGNYTNYMPSVIGISRLGNPTPVGTTDSSGRPIVYETSHYERGSADISLVGNSLNARVYRSGDQGSGAGTAAAAVAYHVKVQNQGSTSRDFFIRFTAPSPTGSISVPYNIGGPSGQQPINVYQKKYSKSRSAVDVLVDNLPVWSTESGYFIPEETSSSGNYTAYAVDFGDASTDDSYTIFVGRFASGATFRLDFIVRTDAVALAPLCGKVSEPLIYPNPQVLMYCFMVNRGRNLPPAPSQNQLFEIYSKDVSTPAFFGLPLSLGATSIANQSGNE